MFGRLALIVVLGLLPKAPAEAGEAKAAPPPPAWIEKPFDGFNANVVHAGVGVSEIKPDMDVTRALSRARAAHSLAASLHSRSASLRRGYENIAGDFTESAGKGFTVREIKGLFSVKTLIRDYSSEINREGEGMIERATLVEFFPGASADVLIQEYTDTAGTSLWTRLVMGGRSAPSEGFQPWDNPHSIKVRDYLNVFANGEEEVYLMVSLRGGKTDISWVEDFVGRGERVGTLKVSGAVSKYRIYGELKHWIEKHGAAGFSKFAQEGQDYE